MGKPISPPAGALFPREHGAWGLLLQPFVASAILSGFWHWLTLPTLALAVLGFMVKEPLIVLARQRWVWRNPNPQTPRAVRWLVAELLAVSLCTFILARHVPLVPLAMLGAAAAALTLTAAWFTLKNRQRSIPLQLLSSAGLGSSALLVALVSSEGFPAWAWQLWAILSLHAATAILMVHGRLRRIAARKKAANEQPEEHGGHSRPTAAALLTQVLAAAAAIMTSHSELALPLLFSAIANGAELYRLQYPASLNEPLRRVGYRAMGISLVHLTLTVLVLWRTVHT